MKRSYLILLAPVLGGILYFSLLSVGFTSPAALTAGFTLWIGLWWIFEPIPIPITSILPFVLFPMAGILSNKEVAQAYGHWLILLLMGGFILSTGMEHSGVHRRLAIRLIEKIGAHSPQRLLLGVMLASAGLSAWISNTATTLMLLPVVLAISMEFNNPRFLSTLLLGLAYSASIGGLVTPIGTPPNIILIGTYQEIFKQSISFVDWMIFATPIAITLLFACYLFLRRSMLSKEKLVVQLPTLPSMSTHEKRFLIVFVITALAWITRSQPYGGWTGLFEISKIGDDTIALAAVVFLFLIPNGQGEKLLTWNAAKDIPWGLLLLFGGGIAIAKAFGASGLSEIIGQYLIQLTDFPIIWMILLICIAVTFLTEITSNTATTTLLMPILGATAQATESDPLLLMVPAALSASCAFMLPVATAPNAIVFGSEKFSIQTMVRKGFIVNWIGVLIITLGCFFLL